MEFAPIDTTGFKWRERALRRVPRFVGDPAEPHFPVMYYRSDLDIHARRMGWMFEDLAPTLKRVFPQLDLEMTRTIILVHDDPETIPSLGDVQLIDKLHMTPEQLATLAQQERAAITLRASGKPKTINGFSYKQMMLHALDKDCLEAQVESLIDKLDGYNEAHHEIHAGNIPFTEPCTTYTKLLKEFAGKFPALTPLFWEDHPLLVTPVSADFETIATRGQLHTAESIIIPTGNPIYDRWRQLHIEKANTDGVKTLTKLKEGYNWQI